MGKRGRVMGEKYDVSGLSEAQYEPGPRRLVIKNMLGIKKKSEMDRLEAIALKQAEDALFRKYGARHCFTAKDIYQMHKLWLGKIYPWAGHYRKVNISKGRFPFAAVRAGMDKNYKPMEEIFKEVLEVTLSCQEGKR